MKNLRFWVVLTIVSVAITAVLSVLHLVQREDARRAAGDRLNGLEQAVVASLDGFVRERAAALRAWSAGDPPPAGFASSFRLVPPEPRPSLRPFGTDTDTWIGFSDNRLVIATTVGDALVEGTITAGVLREHLHADPAVAAPGAVHDAGTPGEHVRFTTLAVLDGRGKPLWIDQPVAADAGPQDAAQALLEDDTERKPYSARQVGKGKDPKFERGLPPSYGGFGDLPVYGIWHRWPSAQELWVVLEVGVPEAERGVGGVRLAYDGTAFGVVHWWHLGVGISVLILLCAVGSFLRHRNERLGVLIRAFTFVRPYRWGIVLVLLCSLLATGISMTKVFFAKFLFDSVLSAPGDEAESRLLLLGIGMVVLALVMGVTAYFQRYLAGYYQLLIMADVRYALGDKLARLPIPYHDRYRTGTLIARFEQDAAHLRKVFTLIFRTVAMEPFKLGWAAIYAFVINPRLALVLFGLPLVVMPLFRIAKRIKKTAKKRQEKRGEISHVLIQMLQGIRVVKAFGGEDRSAERLDEVNQRYVHTSKKITHLSALAEGLLDVMQMLGAAIVMVAGGFLILSNQVTTGDLTAFIVVLQQFYSGSKKLTTTANSLVDASAGVANVFDVLDAENELPDGPGTLERRPLREGVRLEDVTFSYADRKVLNGLTLDIPAGKVVALVGPTGAGKSTICSLVARFYDPDAGRVTYDGVDLTGVSVASVVDSLAIVTQDAFLFNETIADNIRYGKRDATQEEIEQAAKDAFVHDEIERMDEGYLKFAGERGLAVSGGQRQRITIARALLKNAPVLILDEATSALDSHAEQRIQQALDRLMQGRTVLVVAHRLSTILHADKVVVLDAGRVVEEGAPDVLLADEKGRFRRMYDLQMGKDESERDVIDDDEAFA